MISNCAVCGVSDFKPTVFGETRLFVTLCCVVVYCNAVLTVPQCLPPHRQELNPLVYKPEKKQNKTRKKCVEITPATSDFYNPLFWKMN